MTFAGFAASAADVEAEPSGLVAAKFCFRQLCIKVANQVEQFDVGCRVGPRRAADRRLVDVDGLVDILDAGDRFVIARLAFAFVDVSIERLPQNVVDQRTLARTAGPGDADKTAQREFDIDVLQIVMRRSVDRDELSVAGASFNGDFDFSTTGKKLPGDALLRFLDVDNRAFDDDLSTAHARPRSEVDDVVGSFHRLFVMLDDDHRVALVSQVAKTVEQHFVVARVQPDGRLVENVNNVDQSAADLPGKSNALTLAARKRRRRSFEREIIQPTPQQETRSTANFFESLASDVLLRFGQVERLEELPGRLNVQRADF